MFSGHARAVSGCCAEFPAVSVGKIPVGCWIFRRCDASTDGGEGVNRPSRGRVGERSPSGVASGVLSRAADARSCPMQLPFTTEQFFDLLAAYNEALWPALLVLWIASLIAQSAAVLVAPAVGSLDQRPPRRALGLVGAGIPRGVLYANQPRRLGVRRAVPPAGRGLLLGGSRTGASVVRPLAQCMGAGGVGA